MEILKTQRGKDQIYFQGYIYHRDKIFSNLISWRCAVRGCCGRIKTEQEYQTQTGPPLLTGNHNHGPCPEKPVAVKKRSQLKDCARDSLLSTRELIGFHLTNSNSETLVQIGSKNALRQMVYRARNNNNFARIPQNVDELIIPEELKVSLQGENFLLKDKVYEDGRRMLIFSTQGNIQKLRSCSTLLCDGTFKVVPHIFYQLYSIHGLIEGYSIPLVYVLLQNKDLETYQRMWQAILELVPGLSPNHVILDFEKAAFRALTLNIANLSIRGCFFHFGQCIWRKIVKKGLRDQYITDYQIRKFCKFLMALAFVPERDVISTFQMLQISTSFPASLNILYDYFEDTYIGPLRTRGRVEPKFPISCWNVYESTLRSDPRTTNSVEGWHLAFSQSVRCSHPNIFKFIESLQNEQRIQEQNLQYLTIGSIPTYSKSKKIIEREKRIKRIVEAYETREIYEYLEGISSNIEINSDTH